MKEVARYDAVKAAMQTRLMIRLVDHATAGGPGLWRNERLKTYVHLACYGASWRTLCRHGALRRTRTGTPLDN